MSTSYSDLKVEGSRSFSLFGKLLARVPRVPGCGRGVPLVYLFWEDGSPLRDAEGWNLG